ncbi:MAG: formylglycine-generating enzyme family protein [Planctomycetes bacterium]|nr:formylglycine-generating enzyme family protein [Planctomycetota bacterium]
MGKTLKLPAVATGFAIALLPVLFVGLAVAQQKGKKPEPPVSSQEDKDFYFYMKESQKHLDNRKLKDAVNMLSKAEKIRPDDRAVSEMRGKITPDIEGMKEPRINEFEYAEYTHIKTGIVFVLIPGGTFDMGSDDGGVDEKPVHKITLSDFLIAKHEVIQAVWQEVMLKETKSAVGGGNNPSLCKGNTMPVEHVSWNDCRDFCRKTDLRLPTEAEWEYACRAETTTKYYWGNEIDWSYVWYSDNSENRTHPVCKKKPNGYGLYDMAGNVWEWCADWYVDDYYQNSPQNNPKGPDAGQCRVLRGGSCNDYVFYYRPAYRDKDGPESRSNFYGFRPARGVNTGK